MVFVTKALFLLRKFYLMKYILILLFIPSLLFAQSSFEKAEQLFKQENFSSAKPLFKKYLKAHPNDAKTRELLGDIAGYAKDWDVAIDYYESLVDDFPTSANYQFKYGGAMGMKALEISRIRAVLYISDIKEAFETAAKLDAEHIDVRWALIEFYIQLPAIIGGSEEKAVKYANELLAISPVDGYLANGYIAEYNDRPNDAENFYKKAIEIGGSPHTYDKLSEHYEKNNKPKQAIDTAKKSLEIHKRNTLNYQIGKVSAQYNLDAQLGLDCLRAYVANHSIKDGVPKDWAFLRMAQIYKNIGEKKQALTWIDKALENRPDFKEALEEKQILLIM